MQFFDLANKAGCYSKTDQASLGLFAIAELLIFKGTPRLPHPHQPMCSRFRATITWRNLRHCKISIWDPILVCLHHLLTTQLFNVNFSPRHLGDFFVSCGNQKSKLPAVYCLLYSFFVICKLLACSLCKFKLIRTIVVDSRCIICYAKKSYIDCQNTHELLECCEHCNGIVSHCGT